MCFGSPSGWRVKLFTLFTFPIRSVPFNIQTTVLGVLSPFLGTTAPPRARTSARTYGAPSCARLCTVERGGVLSQAARRMWCGPCAPVAVQPSEQHSGDLGASSGAARRGRWIRHASRPRCVPGAWHGWTGTRSGPSDSEARAARHPLRAAREGAQARTTVQGLRLSHDVSDSEPLRRSWRDARGSEDVPRQEGGAARVGHLQTKMARNKCRSARRTFRLALHCAACGVRVARDRRNNIWRAGRVRLPGHATSR